MSEDLTEKKQEGFSQANAEEEILKFWERERIFERSLEKTEKGEPFTFYDGPPFATGLPHYGHILASTAKDLFPRYQTMRGRYVRRRWGWDCHGLPIEEVVERALGISGKKQIEELGIEKFNAICREKVLEFAHEWKKMVRRIARWVDFDYSYKTMDRDFMESVWWAFKQIYDKGLVYEGRKVLMYCPRCETPLSNFEVAMDNSYKDVTEDTAIAKFRMKDGAFILAWTTTPWTLPGNMALAVGPDVDYALVESAGARYVVASALVKKVFGDEPVTIVKEMKGSDLAGLDYEPLFEAPAMQSEASYKIRTADFVTTTDGTGIVHIAPVYGEDDYNLGVKAGLPIVPMLDSKGIFNDKAPESLRGQYFKKADKIVIEDLASRGLLFRKEAYMHSYPHCWRCGTMLYYNALPAWFVNVQKVKPDLLASNEKTIRWYPGHLKHGRYAKSVEQAPDWNISRNRYWGNPIPVWKCEHAEEKQCPPIVVGSIRELGLSTNTFYFTRHGESRSNIEGINVCWPEPGAYDLTDAGVLRAEKLAETLKEKGGVDMIFSSDILRTKRTAEIVGAALGVPVAFDERLREYNVGIYNGKPMADFGNAIPAEERWTKAPEGGETWKDIEQRMIGFIKDIDKRYRGKRILVVSHGDPLWIAQQYYGSERYYPRYAHAFEIEVGIDDLHRPGIDSVTLACSHCGGTARRITEIFDSWTEAGSMPFAEYHYPFDQKETFERRMPAQFVVEYIAQTRAWFYNMHIISQILFGQAPFENAVTTGNILAEDGSKMSKSKKNYPDPWIVIEKYGVDALRFYLMGSPVMQGDDMNFAIADLEIVYRRVVLILQNVHNYYQTYAAQAGFAPSGAGAASGAAGGGESQNPLDAWILARTDELVREATAALDAYDTVRYARGIEGYVDDLSTWYLRRSRGRKEAEFFATLRHALLTVAKVIAPIMPYLSERMYRDLSNDAAVPSVHLADWPQARATDQERAPGIIGDMKLIREAASAGLALRKAANVPIRQPLAALRTKNAVLAGLRAPLLEILKDEVNVKAVALDQGLAADFEFDMAITPELKREGTVRALERAIQDLRKKNGFAVGEPAQLLWHSEDNELRDALALVNRGKTYLQEIIESADAGDAIAVDGKSVALALKKI